MMETLSVNVKNILVATFVRQRSSKNSVLSFIFILVLAHLMPLVSFYTPWKQKTQRFSDIFGVGV